MAGDPPYVPGERYVLFIRPWDNDSDYWLVSAPDGRVLLEETLPSDPAPESASLFIDGEVKETLEGSTLEEITDELEGANR